MHCSYQLESKRKYFSSVRVHSTSSFQMLISQEVAGMSRNDATSHDIGPFPKPKQSLLLVKDLRDVSDS